MPWIVWSGGGALASSAVWAVGGPWGRRPPCGVSLGMSRIRALLVRPRCAVLPGRAAQPVVCMSGRLRCRSGGALPDACESVWARVEHVSTSGVRTGAPADVCAVHGWGAAFGVGSGRAGVEKTGASDVRIGAVLCRCRLWLCASVDLTVVVVLAGVCVRVRPLHDHGMRPYRRRRRSLCLLHRRSGGPSPSPLLRHHRRLSQLASCTVDLP